MHTTAIPLTILSEAIRHQLASDTTLGCGNFLHVAAATNPESDQPFFHLDRSVRLMSGESFDSFSLADVKRVSDEYAAWYYGNGIRAKDPVAVYVGEGIENLIHYVALAGIGAIPILINGNMKPHIAALFIQKSRAMALYTDSEHLTEIDPYLNRDPLTFVVTDEIAAQSPKRELPEVYPYKHHASDVVLVGHSSGTTGVPKAVMFQDQQFFYGIRYRLGLPRAVGSERILSALPHSHSAGIAYLMLAVLSGTPVLVLSSNRPENVLPNFERFRPSMVVAFPETYVEMCEADMNAYDLSSVKLWLNGGDAAHEAHIRKLISFGESIFVDGLGSSEMGFSLFRAIHTPKTNLYGRCIGKPLDWVDAQVLDDNGNKLAPFQVGRLGVQAPSVTPGYWNDTLLTERSRLQGYFLTGDMFYRDEQNNFFHVDRVPDVIRTQGGTLYGLQTEELFMQKFPELADCVVVGVDDGKGKQSPIAFARPAGERKLDTEVLLAKFNALLSELKRPLIAKVLIPREGDIPLGPTGKVLKRELREKFQTLLVEEGR